MNQPEPQIGDFACTQISGLGGRIVDFDQWLIGESDSEYEHAYLYVGNMQVVEAMPHGARVRAIDTFYPANKLTLWSTGHFDLTYNQRTNIAAAGLRLADRHVGYSWADYLAIGLHRLHIPAPGLRQRISSSSHMIRSQLVDYCYDIGGGVHLFTDNRWPGYVTPAQLAELISNPKQGDWNDANGTEPDTDVGPLAP
jgi:hypothetical protein